MRNRAFSCSDELWEEIQKSTEGVITVSAFIRYAILKDLKRLENAGTNKST